MTEEVQQGASRRATWWKYVRILLFGDRRRDPLAFFTKGRARLTAT